MNDKVKKFLIIIIALIPMLFLAWFGIVIYQLDEAFEAMNLEIWEVENQILLNEFYSPDSTKRIGFYNYDSGALGYSNVNCRFLTILSSYRKHLDD